MVDGVCWGQQRTGTALVCFHTHVAATRGGLRRLLRRYGLCGGRRSGRTGLGWSPRDGTHGWACGLVPSGLEHGHGCGGGSCCGCWRRAAPQPRLSSQRLPLRAAPSRPAVPFPGRGRLWHGGGNAHTPPRWGRGGKRALAPPLARGSGRGQSGRGREQALALRLPHPTCAPLRAWLGRGRGRRVPFPARDSPRPLGLDWSRDRGAP
jgi:hypothetical protein